MTIERSFERAVLLGLLLMVLAAVLPAQEAVPRTVRIELTASDVESQGARLFGQFFRVAAAGSPVVVLAEDAEAANVRLVANLVPVAEGGYGLHLQVVDSLFGTVPFDDRLPVASLGADYLLAEFFPKLMATIDGLLPPVLPKVVEVVTERTEVQREERVVKKGVFLTLKAPPGTIIRPTGGKRQTVDATGIFRVELPQGLVYRFFVQAPGCYEQEFTIKMGEQDEMRDLSPDPYKVVSIGLRLSFFELALFPEVEVGLLPEVLSATVGLETSYSSLVHYFSSPRGYHQLSPNLGLRWYLGSPGTTVRFAAGLQGFVRLVTEGEPGLGQMVTAGVSFPLRLEFLLDRSVRLFVDYSPSVYYSQLCKDMSEMNLLGSTGFLVMSFADHWFLSANPDVSLGLRLML